MDEETHATGAPVAGGSATPEPRPNRRLFAWMASLSVLGCVLAFLAYISEPPFEVRRQSASTTRHLRAAVAIRDQADAYQQWGSMLFAYPALRRNYQKVHYFSQRNDLDQKDKFMRTLIRSLEEYDQTDLFLMAHGSKRYLKWIQSELPAHLGQNLRLVYNTGCGNANQGPFWRRLGAQAYIGHGGDLSISPVFFFFFLRRWVRGDTLKRAIHEANWYTQSHLMLVGNFSMGFLHGPTMTKQTRAILYGPPDLRIDSTRPTMVSMASPPSSF